MVRASLPDLAKLREHGYTVEAFTGRGGGYTLTDPDGDHLMIGSHGCIAPTQWEAVAEGIARIDADTQAEALFRARVGAPA